MPKKASEKPRPFEHSTTWSTLTDEVEVGNVKKIKSYSDEPQVSVDGHDQPRSYVIREHTLEVLMHPSLLELHAVRVVRTPHGDKRQLHLKVRLLCAWREVVADVLVDIGAQVSPLGRGLFPDACPKDSDQPVRPKIANVGS